MLEKYRSLEVNINKILTIINQKTDGHIFIKDGLSKGSHRIHR